MDSEQFAKQAKQLVEDDLPRVAAVQKRLAETETYRRPVGRKFADEDPKRGSQSPLGGRIW